MSLLLKVFGSTVKSSGKSGKSGKSAKSISHRTINKQHTKPQCQTEAQGHICMRTNFSHRSTYTHKALEQCPYNGRCTRKNPDHWKQFLHSKQNKPVNSVKKGGKKTRKHRKN
jgi:hypothetical protein